MLSAANLTVNCRLKNKYLDKPQTWEALAKQHLQVQEYTGEINIDFGGEIFIPTYTFSGHLKKPTF